MDLDPPTLLAILAMALATYATRACGVWLASHIPQRGRTRAALDALPAAVLTAVIAPMALVTGPAETLAAVIAAVAATRLPLLAVVLVGVVCVVVLRQVLG